MENSLYKQKDVAWPEVSIPSDGGAKHNFTDTPPDVEPADPGVGPRVRPGNFSAGDEGVAVGDNDWDDPGSIRSGMSHDHPSFGEASGARY